MKVAVVGSCGFIGKFLCQKLNDFHEVVPFSSSNGTGLDRKTGLFNLETKLPRNIDCVIYLAQSPFIRSENIDPNHILSVNVLSVVRAATMAIDSGAKRFIHFSSGSVYQPSFFPLSECSTTSGKDWYSSSKIFAEKSIEFLAADIEIVNLRPFGVFGFGQTGRLVPNLINSVKCGNDIFLQPSKFELDTNGFEISLCSIDDVTSLVLDLLKIESRLPTVINLASKESISIKNLVSRIERIVKKKANFVVTSDFRDGNLVADSSLLSSIVDTQLSSLETSLDLVIQNYLSEQS